jgi:hypothetical protein
MFISGATRMFCIGQRRRFTLVIAMAGIGLCGSVVGAAAQTAIVEDVVGNPAGIELMDSVVTGQTIHLRPDERIVLSYLKSCLRETITGGTVVVRDEFSAVEGGEVQRVKVDCDAGKMQLTAETASKSGAVVLRGNPPSLTIFGLAPLVVAAKGTRMTIERVDIPGEHYAFTSSAGANGRSFYDFASAGQELVAGGLYQITAGASHFVFRVAPNGKPGRSPMVGRLIEVGG